MHRRTTLLLALILGVSTSLVQESPAKPSESPAAASPPAPTAIPTDEPLADVAKRWELDFLGTTACQDKKAGTGISGFGTSFEYAVTRAGTLMSALGLAAQIVRLSCLDGVAALDRNGMRFFYCGTSVSLFFSSKTDRAAVEKERIKLRDFVKRFGAAPQSERMAVARAVVAQFTQCGRQDELRALAAVMSKGLAEYESKSDKLALDKCRATCDPRSKKDWGVGSRFSSATGKTTSPTSDKCFKGCSEDFYMASPLVKFIHRRVLQGISLNEMKELTAALRVN